MWYTSYWWAIVAEQENDMVKTIINEEVLLSYPDGFEEMDREQLKEAFLDTRSCSLRSERQPGNL